MFAVYAVTASRDIINLDVWTANYGSWVLATSGSPWLDGHVLLEDKALRFQWITEGAHGHEVVARAPGVVIAGLPAYWLTRPDSFTLLPGAITAAAMAAASVLLLFLTLTRFTSVRLAVGSSLVFAFATPMWSVSANGIWPHTVTVLGITGMAWASATRRWWLVGIFGGVALWGRLHAAIIVAVLGLLVGFARRRADIVVVIGAVSSLFLGLSCVWNRWMFGTWDPTAAYDAGAFTGYASDHRIDLVNHVGFWVSPDRGILVWTPLLVLLAPTVFRSWRDLPDWVRALAWAGLAYTVVQLTFNRFSGGHAFHGYRLGLELLACLTPAYAISLALHPLRPIVRRVAVMLTGLQLAGIAVGSALDRWFVPTERMWQENAFVNAVRDAPGPVLLLTVAALCLTLTAYRILRGSDEVIARDLDKIGG